MPERVLVFAPHPDDELIGCGGSIVKHLRAGREVFVVFAGDTTAVDCAFMSREDYAAGRQAEIPRVARVIGVPEKNLLFLNEDPWHYSEERLRFAFLEVVRKVKPAICYLPWNRDAHPDHKVVSQAALDAVNMAPSPWFRKYGDKDECPPVSVVLAYEVWAPIESPSYLEPLADDVLEAKMAALREYRTQEVGKYEHAYRGMNAYRGAMHEGGIALHAEAFVVLKATHLF